MCHAYYLQIEIKMNYLAKKNIKLMNICKKIGVLRFVINKFWLSKNLEFLFVKKYVMQMKTKWFLYIPFNIKFFISRKITKNK